MSLVAEKSKSLAIPTSIFRDRDLSVLEAIAEYLKDKKGMRYSEIAQLLNRDDRTIWTSYQRAKQKREQKEKLTQV
jgi:DNA-directed RNA polymerase specialized sigma24 family protein